MKTFSIRIIALSLIFSACLSIAQLKPFPQGISHPGSIKPNHITQSEMNNQVAAFYTYWKAKYLKNDLVSLPGGYYVKGEITGSPEGYSPLGSSEGLGYGMIIAALMAGNDTAAQRIFDGLYKTARAYHSSGNNRLMGWVVADDATAQGHFGSAPDGDLDIAYSLLLAHCQWGSQGKVNYLEEARQMITQGIKASNVTNGYRINLGDWQDKRSLDSRPSDWMVAHFRTFAVAASDTSWNTLLTNTYNMIGTLQSTYSPNTGLLPDFATGAKVKPAAPDFLEGPNDGNYYYNAARVPFRLVIDYGHNGELKAKNAVNLMVNWSKKTTGGNIANLHSGYTLEGDDLSGNNYPSGVFIAPMVAGATCDAAHQKFLNSGWDTIVQMKQGYFEDSFNLLCQLYISGNWWKPSTF